MDPTVSSRQVPLQDIAHTDLEEGRQGDLPDIFEHVKITQAGDTRQVQGSTHQSRRPRGHQCRYRAGHRDTCREGRQGRYPGGHQATRPGGHQGRYRGGHRAKYSRGHQARRTGGGQGRRRRSLEHTPISRRVRQDPADPGIAHTGTSSTAVRRQQHYRERQGAASRAAHTSLPVLLSRQHGGPCPKLPTGSPRHVDGSRSTRQSRARDSRLSDSSDPLLSHAPDLGGRSGGVGRERSRDTDSIHLGGTSTVSLNMRLFSTPTDTFIYYDGCCIPCKRIQQWSSTAIDYGPPSV